MGWASVSICTKTDFTIICGGNLVAVIYQQDVLIPVTIPHIQTGGRGMILMHDDSSHSNWWKGYDPYARRCAGISQHTPPGAYNNSKPFSRFPGHPSLQIWMLLNTRQWDELNRGVGRRAIANTVSTRSRSRPWCKNGGIKISEKLCNDHETEVYEVY